MALFKEKYGDKVRVVKVGDFSEELCGGTHVKNTGEIGLFKILYEGSVSAGVRRIEAITGTYSLEYLRNLENNWLKIRELLDATNNDVFEKLEKTKEKIKTLELEIKKLKQNSIDIDNIFNQKKAIKDIKYVVQKFENLDQELLRETADKLVDKGIDLVVFFNVVNNNKVIIVVKKRKNMSKLHAGNIAKELAKILGGGGGGRPDFAQAGGKVPSKIKDAIEKLEKILGEC